MAEAGRGQAARLLGAASILLCMLLLDAAAVPMFTLAWGEIGLPEFVLFAGIWVLPALRPSLAVASAIAPLVLIGALALALCRAAAQTAVREPARI